MKEMIKKSSPALIFIGLAVGIIVGLIVNALGGAGSPFMSFVGFAGNLYLNALKMMVYPLIFCSIVVGVTEVGNAAATGKIALKSVIYFLITTALASIVAVIVPVVTKLGVNSPITVEAGELESDMTGILDMLANMIPANPIAAFAEGNVMQILIFAIVIGFAILAIGEKADPALKFIASFNEICMTIIKFIVRFTPLGACFLIMPITANNKFGAITGLLNYVITYYVTIIAFVVIVYFGVIKFVAKGNPIKFFKESLPAVMTGFATSSSTATLPVSEQVADDMGIRKEISSIVLPIGSTMNMDGGAIMLLMSTIFFCNICGIHLSVGQIITLCVANIFLSVGTPAIPNGGIATFTALVVMAGLPAGVMSLFVGTMSVTNYGNTAVNILGDLTGCAFFNQLEDNKDKKSA